MGMFGFWVTKVFHHQQPTINHNKSINQSINQSIKKDKKKQLSVTEW